MHPLTQEFGALFWISRCPTEKTLVSPFWRYNWRMWNTTFFFFPLHPPTRSQKQLTKTQMQRTGIIWSDSFLYMIPSSFHVSNWLLSLRRLNFHFLVVSLHVRQPTLTFKRAREDSVGTAVWVKPQRSMARVIHSDTNKETWVVGVHKSRTNL